MSVVIGTGHIPIYVCSDRNRTYIYMSVVIGTGHAYICMYALGRPLSERYDPCYSIGVMTHVIALAAGQSSQGI